MKPIHRIGIVAFVLMIAMMLSPAQLVAAHTTSQKGILAEEIIEEYGDGTQSYVGGERVGWSIDEGYHTNGTNITYSFSTTDPYLSSAYRVYVTGGADKWSSLATIILKTDGTGMGEISTFYNPNTGTIAQFCNYSSDSSGHLRSWEIQMNRAYQMSATTLAHEFGHVIGLNDLYDSRNIGKLMYGRSDSTATQPTDSDIWGAMVITGMHAAHTWGYKYYDITSTGNYRHIKYCTDCMGLTETVERCTYASNGNRCLVCKHIKSNFEMNGYEDVWLQ